MKNVYKMHMKKYPARTPAPLQDKDKWNPHELENFRGKTSFANITTHTTSLESTVSCCVSGSACGAGKKASWVSEQSRLVCKKPFPRYH